MKSSSSSSSSSAAGATFPPFTCLVEGGASGVVQITLLTKADGPGRAEADALAARYTAAGRHVVVREAKDTQYLDPAGAKPVPEPAQHDARVQELSRMCRQRLAREGVNNDVLDQYFAARDAMRDGKEREAVLKLGAVNQLCLALTRKTELWFMPDTDAERLFPDAQAHRRLVSFATERVQGASVESLLGPEPAHKKEPLVPAPPKEAALGVPPQGQPVFIAVSEDRRRKLAAAGVDNSLLATYFAVRKAVLRGDSALEQLSTRPQLCRALSHPDQLAICPDQPVSYDTGRAHSLLVFCAENFVPTGPVPAKRHADPGPAPPPAPPPAPASPSQLGATAQLMHRHFMEHRFHRAVAMLENNALLRTYVRLQLQPGQHFPRGLDSDGSPVISSQAQSAWHQAAQCCQLLDEGMTAPAIARLLE